MAWFTTGDLDEFVAAAGGFLRARPVENTILLTIVDSLRSQRYGEEPARFGWWQPAGGRVGSAFLQTPPYPAVLADVPDEAVAPLVEMLSGVDRISAERRVADAIAAQWRRQAGITIDVHQRVRLYRLDKLTPPDPIPAGSARLAEPADRELLLSWHTEFMRELGEPAGDVETMVDYRMGYGGVMVWEAAGAPVSMAGRTRPTAGMIRVAPVFTPVDLRRRGYAGAVTAAVSRTAQELVDDVLLMTDLANPTSNAIYQRLGYRAVEDRLVLTKVGEGSTQPVHSGP
jgi:predicted GNAT family acetyltransferase